MRRKLRKVKKPAVAGSRTQDTSGSNFRRLKFLKETACSQEWLVLQGTNAHQMRPHCLLGLLFEKNCVEIKEVTIPNEQKSKYPSTSSITTQNSGQNQGNLTQKGTVLLHLSF